MISLSNVTHATAKYPTLHRESVSHHNIHLGGQNAIKAKNRRIRAHHAPHLLLNVKDTTALKMNLFELDKTGGISPT